MKNYHKTSVNDVKWIRFKSLEDRRGKLTAIEGSRDIPFDIKRVFYMHDINSDRGGHSHLDTDQVAISIAGKFSIAVHDGQTEKIFDLDDPTVGLFIPRRLFTRLYKFDPLDICLVLANTYYDMSHSQRTWEDFLVMKKEWEK